jgi:hypothetical protein
MPNHVHLVFGIDHPIAKQLGFTANQFGPLQTRSLQLAINGYKGAVTTARKRAGYTQFAWQSRFYESII